MSDGIGRVHEKIRSFQKKYYLNLFIKGIILTLSILIGYFVLASILEHNLWMGPSMRLMILITFFGIAGLCIIKYLNQPLQWWIAKKGLSEEESAKVIGSSIPTVKDRLLNLIQLSSRTPDSALTFASIRQKTRELEPLTFESVVNYGENKKYLKYLAIPLLLVITILIFNSSIITQSTERFVHFSREYSPLAPFRFIVENERLEAFYNEDFTLKIRLEGNAIPENVYLINRNQRLKLSSAGDQQFVYVFERMQKPVDLQIEAAGFYSDPFSVKLINRPELVRFNLELEYPRYIQRRNEKVANAGNLEIPEGTMVRWKLNASNTMDAHIKFASGQEPQSFQSSDNQLYVFSKKFNDPDQYEIILQNNESKNKDKIAFTIDVVKDEYPQISVNNYRDSVLFKRVILGGVVGDDYGVTKLLLHYRIRNGDQQEILKKQIRIPIQGIPLQQSFFHNWALDSMELEPGHQLEYYLEVWDNDGVNGRKSTKSSSYTFLIPTADNLVAEISRSQSRAEEKIDQSVNRASKLQDQIENANQKLKGKQNLDWQDKKMLEDIIQQKRDLEQIVEQMKSENKMLEDKKNAFTEQNERIKEKAGQIQKLMNELLDDETKKLFEELQKLLKENTDITQIQKLLDKLNQNTNNLEKELERTLELFKELKYEFKLDQTIQDLKKQVEDQKEILDKTEALEKENAEKNLKDQKSKENNKRTKQQSDGNKENSSDTKEAEDLAKDQEELNEDFKKTSEDLKELEKLGDELDKNDQLPSDEEKQEVQDQQQQSKEMLDQKNPAKAKTPQKNALQKMQQMKQQMESMQNAMSMEMDMQNIESLRQIIHGLVKLSFDQESLMKDFNELQQNDPRFNGIAQRQLKLKDDSKVLEDSLLALGKRDPLMGSFITKEIGELNNHLEKVIVANRERRRPQAANEMQLSMTSINNLALMLDDHFDMMMQMMQNAGQSMSKKKQKGQKPSLSQMQQQLNDRIEQLKSKPKNGRQLSEELAEMAAEQERIRRALQEMQEKMKNEGLAPGGDLPSKMEQSEMDLVNKQLTDQLIRRQKEIMTRLLEAEKSMREQDMDEERKGETARDYEKEIPKAFEEYLRLKEKEVELLKTVPPKLYPYYKKEVSEYFKRMGNK